MFADKQRYDKMMFRRLGNSGIKLPLLSVGLWNNFGDSSKFKECEELIWHAFNNGITHFDLANNYGPPPGSAERTMGRILKRGLDRYRDELIITTKAGYKMDEGPYQDGGSRKYLMSSLDQSLNRLNLEYVDIFYHHRFDDETSLKETIIALRDIVASGKALYVGLSNYNSKQLKEAYQILDKYDVPYIINQFNYSMLNREIENDKLMEMQNSLGGGNISFSTLAQGLLSNKYIDGIPIDSRVLNEEITYLNEESITDELREKLIKLNEIAVKRDQNISQLAIVWALRNELMTSVLVGVRTKEQLQENIDALNNLELSKSEIKIIDKILK